MNKQDAEVLFMHENRGRKRNHTAFIHWAFWNKLVCTSCLEFPEDCKCNYSATDELERRLVFNAF